jgi:TetR/AcrR family transcriptional regulator, cholesterol catabolism regulator
VFQFRAVSVSPAESSAAPARLAASQLRRIRRVVDAAIALAERGGFDAVKLRDVAEASGVALGTLYKYFRSKEEILLFAVNEDMERLEAVMGERPPAGATPTERITEFFARATRGFVRRPAYAQAVLRGTAMSPSSTAVQQAGFHLRMSRMVVAALRGEPSLLGRRLAEPVGSERERRIALVLEHVWFACLLGWVSGLHPVKTITERMEDAVSLLLEQP